MSSEIIGVVKQSWKESSSHIKQEQLNQQQDEENNNLIINHQFLTNQSSSSSSDFSTESLISCNTDINNVVDNLTKINNNNNFIENVIDDDIINDNNNNINDIDSCTLFNENEEDDLTCNIIDSSNFIQSNSPLSSSSSTLSLPPLPGLIPIRKANINISNNNNNNNNNKQHTSSTTMAPLSIKKTTTPTNKSTSSSIKNGIANLKIPITIINNNDNNKNNNNNNNSSNNNNNYNNNNNNSNSISSQNKTKSVHFSTNTNNNDNYSKNHHSKINNNINLLEADNNDLILKHQLIEQQQEQSIINDENDDELTKSTTCTPDSNKENLSSSIFSDNYVLPTKPNNLLDNQQTSTSTITSSSLEIIPNNVGNENNAQNITIKSKRGRKVKIKTEIIDGGSGNVGGNEEIIPHRKSDRRRIARDIFFLIEEYPTNRRRKNGKACNSKGKKPRGRPKSKFAHLRATNNSSILRHQDNEPRAISPIKKQLPPPNIQQPQEEQQSDLTKDQPIILPTSSPTPTPQQPIIKSIKLPHLNLPSSPVPKNVQNLKSITTPAKVPNKNIGCIKKINTNNKDVSQQPARVNPIFLWVKQDDTRIVEVRCEDYDKRNRIRLTKTPNGWKAIPRTDPTTSRVAKLVPNPLVKIKQERRENLDLLALSTSSKDSSCENSQCEVSDFGSLKKRIKNKKKKKKKKKKKRKHDLVNEEHKERLVLKIPALQQTTIPQDISPIVSSKSPPQNILSPPTPNNNDVIVYESTNHERNDCDDDLLEKSVLPNIIVENNNDINTNCENNNRPNINGTTTTAVNEPNNNEEPTPDLTKNLTVLSDDDIEMQIPQFMVHHPDKEFNSQLLSSLCPTNSVYEHINNQNHLQQSHIIHPQSVSNDHQHDVLSDSFDPSDVDSKQLKDLLDDPDLLQHCDNALSGAELIDSLVKRGCEDNHISEDDEQQHHHCGIINKTTNESSSCINDNTTICLTDDFDNEDDDLLMRPEPVEDIISRLGDSLAASPKCLSFNEAGEIEGLHGELFQTNTQSDPFNRTALEELSITIKDLEKSSDNFVQQSEQNLIDCNTTTIVSPDSCADELPKDLTCKKTGEQSSESTGRESPEVIEIDRPNSRSSDAIQSPQPSGLPPVPPSPDLMHSKSNKFLDQLFNATSSTSPKFCSSLTVTPIKIHKNPQHQKEPLDLGKHRKSASPTVSCSEEANRNAQPKQAIVTIDIDAQNEEPAAKRIKREASTQNKNHTENLMEILSSGKDPDPLMQLRLLISNPEWKVPDPILVPKDRLNAVLASPAREIPLLLTTRPELRLPEAFAYPAILQDPDILVISMAQLESILQKQVEITPKSKPLPILPQVTIEAVCNKNRTEKPTTPDLASSQPNELPNSKKTATTATSNTATGKNLLNPLVPLLASGLAGDIDSATMAAFNQMLWLPYLGQMAPDLFKAMNSLQNSGTNNLNNIAELLPLIAAHQQAQQSQQQQQQQSQSAFNPAAAVAAMAYQNPLEIAMWQQALTQAQMQRVLKLQQQQQNAAVQREQVKKNENKINAQRNLAALFAAQRNIDYSRISNELQQKSQSVQQSQKSRSLIGINPFRQEHNRTQQRNSSNTSASTPSSIVSTTEKKDNPIRSLNPFHQNYAHGGVDITPVIRKAKQQNQQQHNITSNNLEQKPRVTCKSLSNLLQPDRYSNPAMADTKMSNLMAMSGFDFNLASAVNPFQLQSNVSGQQQSNFHQGQFSSSSTGSSSSTTSSQQNNVSRNSHHNSSINSQHNKNNNNNQQQQRLHSGKLKVKSGSHLLDPAAVQRRLLNCDDVGEVGSTTSSLDEMMMTDPNTALWHPLFGSAQKSAYTSPWQWTTVTATGE